MRLRTLVVSLLPFAGLGCNSTNVAPVSTGSSKRSYNGSAFIGDFLAITLNPVALTLTYKTLSNGDTGVVPFTVNADGTYALNDPNQNLLAAYEVPNYALLLQAAKAGPNHDTLPWLLQFRRAPFPSPRGPTTITTTCSSGLLPEVLRWVPFLWTRRQVSA